MPDVVQPTALASSSPADAALPPAPDVPTASDASATDLQVGDLVRGRAVFGIRKIAGQVLVIFDQAGEWQPV